MKKSLFNSSILGRFISAVMFTAITVSLSAVAVENISEKVEPEKGVHNGRLFTKDSFVVELSIFETGVPPEFRVWVTDNGEPVMADAVLMSVKLARLGGVVDKINFIPQGDFLRGDMEIYEPHSFKVAINVIYNKKEYEWKYDNFEGRTTIEEKVSEAMNIQTSIVAEQTMSETIEVFGRIMPAQEANSDITARFDGEIKSMPIRLGDSIKRGDVLATIESNESLKPYEITSPIDGIITAKFANVGEQTEGRALLSVTNLQNLTAELSVFPLDRNRIRLDAPVKLDANGVEVSLLGKVKSVDSFFQNNQSTTIRVPVDNTSESYFSGQFIQGSIEVDRYSVPLAVKRSGLQKFRDFTVVYAKVGEQYEVRMLELGREAGEWVEVLGGIDSGTEYVTENSFIIKADIEKSGASHDH